VISEYIVVGDSFAILAGAKGAYFTRNFESLDANTSSATPRPAVPPRNFGIIINT
jgi:hypothetical protein